MRSTHVIMTLQPTPLRMMTAGVILAFALSLLVPRAEAGEPQDKIKQTITDVLNVLSDESLKAPDKLPQRRAKIRQVVTSRFGFEEMARRSLGRHWRKLKPAQKKEFVPLFSDLLERSYINKIEAYASSRDLEILYTKETIDKEGYAMVRTEIVSKRDLNFEVEYRLLQNKGNWETYDIVIEGVSLVNNYRTQFNKIIRQDSYQTLVKKLRLKIEQQNAVQ